MANEKSRFDWRERLPGEIWPRSRFAHDLPQLKAACASPSCEQTHRTFRFPCKHCGKVVYCSKDCRANAKGFHRLVCDSETLPARVEQFLAEIINQEDHVVFTTLARNVYNAGRCAAELEKFPILPAGHEPTDLVRREDQSDDQFTEECAYAFVERVFNAVGMYVDDSQKNPLTREEIILLPPGPRSDSALAGVHLFAAVVFATTGILSAVPVATLVAWMHCTSFAQPRGFSFFILEEGRIATLATNALTFAELYEDDAVGEKANVSAIYLLQLMPVAPATLEQPLTVFLWRVGEVAHLHLALPGHYPLGQWMCRNRDLVDTSGYATKPMTQDTVLTEYATDLALLTDENASAFDRRHAFCRAFGLHPSALKLEALGLSKEKDFPLFAILACRAFAY